MVPTKWLVPVLVLVLACGKCSYRKSTALDYSEMRLLKTQGVCHRCALACEAQTTCFALILHFWRLNYASDFNKAKY